MTAEWTPTKLGRICKFQAGDGFPKELQGDEDGEYPVAKVSDMNLAGNELFIINANNWLSETAVDQGFKLHPPGAVVFAKIGVALTTNRRRILVRPTVIDNNMMSATCTKEIDPRWFYSLLSTLDFNEISSGSALPYLTVKDLSGIPVRVPPLPEQRVIAATLGALDDQIELNRKMNATLESTARALFRDWFVDFGPTLTKMEGGEPYLSPDLWSLFPDRLDDDGKPEGWEHFRLEQIAEHHKRAVSPSSHPDTVFEHFSLPEFDKGQSPALDLGETIKSNKTLVPAYAVLLSKLNPEIPRVWLPETSRSLPQIASTEFLTFTGRNKVQRGLLFCLFRDDQFREMLKSMVTGTSKSHQRVSPPDLMRREVLVGQSNVFAHFEEIVAPLLNRALANRAESRILAQTRDLLLPRLMSGELRVAEAERLASKVA